MDVLSVKYSLGNAEGCIELYVEGFFPCTKKKLKALIPLMSQTEKSVIEDLIHTLQGVCRRCEEICESSAKSFHKAHQGMVDCQQIISDGKYPNGVPLTENELAMMKVDLKAFEYQKKFHHQTFTKYHDKQKKLSQNIEMLGQLL